MSAASTSETEKCAHCVTGHVHAGAPTGSIETVGGLRTYVARPAADAAVPKTAVLIATDIFGVDLPNVRLIADGFAARGLLTFVPDLHGGDSVPADALQQTPPKVDLPAWMTKHGVPETMPLLRAVVDDLRGDKWGIERLAAQGYCWGARFVVLMAATDDIDAFAVAHPSRVQVPTDIEAIKKPGCWLLAETDRAFSPEQVVETKAALAKKPDLPVEYHEYPGTVHGFAVRGSDADERVVAARADALEKAAAFFKRVLAAA